VEDRAIEQAAGDLSRGRSWLSCEPVAFYPRQDDGHLLGGSKPNFQPHADDAAAAALSGLPDGTVHDLIEILCKLSNAFQVDWEFSHDHAPGPIGFIRGGVCEPGLLERIEHISIAVSALQEKMDEFELEADDDGGPMPSFRPKGG